MAGKRTRGGWRLVEALIGDGWKVVAVWVSEVKVELNGGGRMRFNLMRLVWQFVETH